MDKEVEILDGNVSLDSIEPVYEWPGIVGEDCKIQFNAAYEIERKDWNNGIVDCIYRVHEREFKDLSFLQGETIEEFPDNYEIRTHEDGTRFLFHYSDIPTFDYGDRAWNSMLHLVVYADKSGVNMIYCRHGYAIGRIRIYIGMSKSIPIFSEWLRKALDADGGGCYPGSKGIVEKERKGNQE